jgi:hypothetical protein
MPVDKKIAFQNGKPIFRNGKLAFASSSSEACGCCCDPTPCGEITLRYVDENRCEDDVFDIFVYNPDTMEKRFLGELDMKSTPPECCGSNLGVPCPQTTVDLVFTPTPEEISGDCKIGIEAKFKRANCCGTLARFTLIGPTGTRVESSSFSIGGLKQTFLISDICNECAVADCGPIAIEWSHTTYPSTTCDNLGGGPPTSPIPGAPTNRSAVQFELLPEHMSEECEWTIEIWRNDGSLYPIVPSKPNRIFVVIVLWRGDTNNDLPFTGFAPQSYERTLLHTVDLDPFQNGNVSYTMQVGKLKIVGGMPSVDPDGVISSLSGYVCPPGTTGLPHLSFTFTYSESCFQ